MMFKQVPAFLASLAAFTFLAGVFGSGQPVLAQAVKSDGSSFASLVNVPVYQWQDKQRSPRAVVLAIHGLTMHGTIFDAFAKNLVSQGAIVIAPDLRGYGAWYKQSSTAKINYQQSEKDLLALTCAIRKRYKGLPLFVAGESLGGSMAIRLAAKHPEVVDGLILSSPALKLCCPPKTMVDSLVGLLTPGHELDLTGLMQQRLSEDSQITQEGLTDPLIRRRLSAVDLLESCRFIAGTRRYVAMIPARMPVLVMQGEADRIVKPSGALVLDSKLKSVDKTVELLPSRGHILIETQHIHPDDMNTIVSWINSECANFTMRNGNIATAQTGGYGGRHEGGAVANEHGDSGAGS